MRVWTRGWPLLAALLCLAGCATHPGKADALQEAEYAWSAVIRWGDFEGAWNMVDPAVRKAHPLTDLEFARYKQVQISEYRELGAQDGDGTATREVQIGVVSRNSLAERQVRYTETWRYDPVAKAWWITGGLPDLWPAQ